LCKDIYLSKHRLKTAVGKARHIPAHKLNQDKQHVCIPKFTHHMKV